MMSIDTGASVPVVSCVFKQQLDCKNASTFRAVSEAFFHPVRVCTVSISVAGKTFKAEFAVLVQSMRGSILGIDFLQECRATVDCGAERKPNCI